MEHSKPAPDGRSVIREYIIGKPKAWVYIRPIDIALKHMRDIRISGGGTVIGNGEQIVVFLHWIAGRLIPESHIQHEFRRHLPIVLNVKREIDIAKIADIILIGCVRNRRYLPGLSCQE